MTQRTSCECGVEFHHWIDRDEHVCEPLENEYHSNHYSLPADVAVAIDTLSSDGRIRDELLCAIGADGSESFAVAVRPDPNCCELRLWDTVARLTRYEARELGLRLIELSWQHQMDGRDNLRKALGL